MMVYFIMQVRRIMSFLWFFLLDSLLLKHFTLFSHPSVSISLMIPKLSICLLFVYYVLQENTLSFGFVSWFPIIWWSIFEAKSSWTLQCFVNIGNFFAFFPIVVYLLKCIFIYSCLKISSSGRNLVGGKLLLEWFI